MKTHFVVTGLVINKDRVLILKKAPDDYNYPNKWSFCSGFVKEFEPAEESILREIKEETGLSAEIKEGPKIITVEDKEKQKRWVIAVFLCQTKDDQIKLCSENVDFKWVTKKETDKYDGVPSFKKDLELFNL